MARRSHRRGKAIRPTTAIARHLKRTSGAGISISRQNGKPTIVVPGVTEANASKSEQPEETASQQPANSWLLRCQFATADEPATVSEKKTVYREKRTASSKAQPSTSNNAIPERTAQPPKLERKSRSRRKRPLTPEERAARHPFGEYIKEAKRLRLYRRRPRKRLKWEDEVEQLRSKRDRHRKRKQQLQAGVRWVLHRPAWCWQHPWQATRFAAALALSCVLVSMVQGRWAVEEAQVNLAVDFNQAFEDGEYDLARQHLAGLGPLPAATDEEAAQLNFRAAWLQAEAGDVDEAREKIEKLAGEFDYTPAHMWLARHEVVGKPLNDANIEQSSKHLEAVIDGQPANAQALRDLAHLETARKRYGRATELLNQIAEPTDLDRLNLAWLYAQVGNQTLAEEEAYQVLRRNRPLALEKYDLQAGLLALQATVAVRGFGQSDDLVVSLERHLEHGSVCTALSEFHLLWARHLMRRQDPDLPRAVELLSRAARYPVVHTAVFTTLGVLGGRDDNVGLAAQAVLAQVIARTDNSLAHRVMGDVAYKQKRIASAINHYTVAASNPREAVARNNLAWLMLQSDTNLETALSLVDQALKLKPNAPEFRDTRGRILARMGEYENALDDLQEAAGKMADNRELHETLALVYDQLNLPDMGVHHRQQAERLSEKK